MKNSLVLLCCAVFAILLVGCGSGKVTKFSNPATNQKDAEAANAYLESGEFTLIVGFDAEFPPYGFQNENGELVGFDLDLAKETAKRQNWKIELRPVNWDSKDAELNSGTINCIWNGFTINGREKLYTWSAPYVDSSQVIMVRKDSGIATLKDLAGKVVEAQADSSGLKAIMDDSAKEIRESLKKLIEVPNFNQAHMELVSGACDAVVIDYSVAQGFLKDDEKCAILEETLMAEQYGVGFKLGNTALRDKVQQSIDEMLADGTFRTISEKWFDGKDVSIVK